MALVNPNIAMSYRQPDIQAPNALAQFAQIQQIQGGRQAQELAQYQLGAAQRGEARDIARINALAGAGSDETAVANALLRSGDIAGYSAFVKAAEDRRTQKLTQQKTEGEIAGQPTTLAQAQSTLLDNKLKQARGFLDTIDPAAPDAPQRYLAWHEANHRDPIIGAALTARGISADQARQSIMAAIEKGPAAFAQMLNQSKLGTEKFMEMNKPTTQVIDQSGQRQILQQPGLGGPCTNMGTFADVPLPAAVEAQKGRIANAGAARQITNVNTQIPASEEAQKEYMKEARVTFNTLKSVPSVLNNMEEAKKLIPSAKSFMGPGGEPLLNVASFLNNRLGTSIATENVTDATVLRSRLFTGVIENLRKLDAQPTQAQQQVLQDAIGNLGTDPTALPRVLDAFGNILREKVSSYNTEVKDAETRGVKFPYNPVINIPETKKPADAAAQIPGNRPAPAAAPASAIPQGAIDRLKAGGGTDAQFDAIFGPGAAKRARGGK